MNYYPPKTVIGPKYFLKNVNVIYDGGPNSVSVAELDWEGNHCLAMRWNIARREWDETDKQNNKKICVGMPSSHGFPVWFLIPDDAFDPQTPLGKAINDYYNKS